MFHKYFYLQFYSADNQTLGKVYKHIASSTQYCLTLKEKSAVIINNSWYLCEAPTVDWHHTKRFFSHSSPVFREEIFKEAFGTSRPRNAATSVTKILLHSHSVPICKKFPCEGLAYKGILLFLTCKQANPSAVQFIPLFSLYSCVSLSLRFLFVWEPEQIKFYLLCYCLIH